MADSLLTVQTLALPAIALGAALVNGALGYGFSSITIPLALLWLPNRTLNPALVVIEVVLNACVLWVNRAAVPLAWRRVWPIVTGLLPGILVGTLIVSRVHPEWLKFGTFVVLLPLILIQAAGLRRPVRAERPAGLAFGGGLGVLYSVTTISGPPLAIALKNQGLSRGEFLAALGLVRLAESTLTAAAYLAAGLFGPDNLMLAVRMAPSVAIGVPLGTVLIRHLRPRTFGRMCVSFDAWVVSFGIATLLRRLHVIDSRNAYFVVAAVALVDGWLLYRFFSGAPAGAVAHGA